MVGAHGARFPRGAGPRPVFAGCDRRRGTPRYAPGSPGQPLQACGVRAAATGRRGHPQLQASGLHPSPVAVTEVAGQLPRQPPRFAPSQSPTWTRPPRPDPAKCPEPGTCGRGRGKRRATLPYTGFKRVGACPDTWGNPTGSAPASRPPAEPSCGLRGATPTARRRRSAFSRRRPDEEGAAAEKSGRSKVWTPAGFSLPRVGGNEKDAIRWQPTVAPRACPRRRSRCAAVEYAATG